MRAADNGKPADAILGVGDLQPHSGSAVGDDCALYLLDREERVVAWYAGAVRVYGYPADEVLGHKLACLYPDPDAGDDSRTGRLREELQRASDQFHVAAEGWQVRKDGSDPDSGRMLSR
jgi:formate hydrogenlyase transcriptional activator